MSSIEQTVTESLNSAGLSRYSREAQPVIAALVEREQAITDAIVAAAVSNRVINSEEQGKDLARSFGLSVRPDPEPVSEEAPATESLSIVAAVQQAVNEAVAPLVAFARQHGYRG